MSKKTKSSLSSGCVNGETSTLRPPRIISKKFAGIIKKIYTAIIHNKGLYAIVKMETHAPQIKYFPGSPLLPHRKNETSNQVKMFDGHHEKKPIATVVPGTLEHRRWLWFAVHEDRQDLSEFVYQTHCKIFEDHPEFYEAGIVDMNTKEFEKILSETVEGKRKYKIAEPNLTAIQWQTCARTLFNEFEGDPVKLLKHAGWSVDSVYKWKNEQTRERGYDPIPGWGRKLISLYFLYLADLGFVLPDDAFPADLHAQAFLQQTNTLDWGDRDCIYSSMMAELVRKEISNLCKEKKYDVVIVAHAKWLLGSFLCNGCASNKNVPYLCPIYEECKGRVDTGSYTAGKWYKHNKIQTKGGERPRFGLPTEFAPRISRARKRKPVQVKNLNLFKSD